MEDREWEFLLGEIKEIRSDVKAVREEMTTLKVKVALFSSFVGSVATFIVNKIF